MEWSIQEIAKLAGTTSRTLRHYDAQGLLPPTRIGGNGYRYYDESALVRLQRILLLRDLGVGLSEIKRILDARTDEVAALSTHLDLLQRERGRLDRQITAVRHTIHSLQEGRPIMADQAFDGFDHTQYRDEVESRWGKDAYASSDRWWNSMDEGAKADFMSDVKELNAAWVAAAADPDITPESDEAQALAARHVAWLKSIPGTPSDTEGYVRGLADMYVADPRFAANYGGETGAGFVRDALTYWLES